MKNPLGLAQLGCVALAISSGGAEARITQIEVLKAELAFGGASFR